MKILYTISARGTNLNIKEGYYVHVKEIYCGLKQLGHDVHLLAISDQDLKSEFPESTVVKHRYIPLIHHIIPYTGFIDSINYFFKIIHIYKHFKFDVIHNRWGLRILGAHFAAKFLKIPMLLEVNGPGIEEKALFSEPYKLKEEILLKFIRKIQMKMCDHIFAVSNILKEIMINWGISEQKISVIPNAANPEMYKNVHPTLEIRKNLNWKDKIIVTYTGTLHVWYGLEYLPSIFKEIVKSFENVRFLIVGNGQYKEDFQNQIKTLRLNEFVHFYGAVNHSLIPNILLETDIVIAPYKDLPMGFFNSPLKIFEYMMAGKAIVTTAIGQNNEILVHNQTALLVPPDNIDSLANALIELVLNPDKAQKLAQNAKKEALLNHTWKDYCKKLVTLYQQIGK